MGLAEARHQKPAEGAGLAAKGTGRDARSVCGSGEAEGATRGHERSGTDRLMEQVVERDNMFAALKRVRANKGSPGIDGMTVDALVAHWPMLHKTTAGR